MSGGQRFPPRGGLGYAVDELAEAVRAAADLLPTCEEREKALEAAYRLERLPPLLEKLRQFSHESPENGCHYAVGALLALAGNPRNREA